MTCVKIIGILCGLLISSTFAQLKCGENEMEVQCGADCETDYCPKKEGPYESCPIPKECPDSSCKCIFDHRRALNGSCIPTRQCPPFECTRPHEVYTPCSPACSDDCSNATPYGGCPPTFGLILLVLPCIPSCRCEKGYWRQDGSCVP